MKRKHMPSLLDVSIASFATYYAALVIATKAGPFGVLAALRRLLWARHLDGHGHFCVVCASAWTAALAALYMTFLGISDPGFFPLVWLGLAGAAALIDKVWKR